MGSLYVELDFAAHRFNPDTSVPVCVPRRAERAGRGCLPHNCPRTTGTGKTIATLFPSIKAMGEGKAQKIFYLTAKSVGSRVAEDTLEICRSKGLKFKDVCLTAKEKVCVLDRPECNPDACPRAKGHFDRINAAIYDLLTTADNFSRTTIQEYAEKHNVCPLRTASSVTTITSLTRMRICAAFLLKMPRGRITFSLSMKPITSWTADATCTALPFRSGS